MIRKESVYITSNWSVWESITYSIGVDWVFFIAKHYKGGGQDSRSNSVWIAHFGVGAQNFFVPLSDVQVNSYTSVGLLQWLKNS